MYVAVGFVTALTTIGSSTGFVALPAYRTCLRCVCLIDFLELNTFSMELIFEVFHHLSKVPVREFLSHFSGAELFLVLVVLFLSSGSIALDTFGVAAVDVLHIMVDSPVHKIFRDFVCTISNLSINLVEHISFGFLEFSPTTGAFLATSLLFVDFLEFLVS